MVGPLLVPYQICSKLSLEAGTSLTPSSENRTKASTAIRLVQKLIFHSQPVSDFRYLCGLLKINVLRSLLCNEWYNGLWGSHEAGESDGLTRIVCHYYFVDVNQLA